MQKRSNINKQQETRRIKDKSLSKKKRIAQILGRRMQHEMARNGVPDAPADARRRCWISPCIYAILASLACLFSIMCLHAILAAS